MSILCNSNVISGDASIDTGDIPASLRFRGAQHLNRTFGTPTSNTSWAMSWRQKDCTDGATKFVLGAGLAGFGFHSSNVFRIWDNGGGAVASSTALLRDPTGHSHYFVRSNGTNIKAYRNNEEIASYTGTITSLNSAIAHLIGRYANAAQDYINDYMSRIAFVDNGGSLIPGDFAYLNTTINEWVSKSQSEVKAVVDAGGANSFMLDFDDATSLTTLGHDKSSKGNNWTLNNFSLTAGPNYDHMLDVPGNSYATLNPLKVQGTPTLAGGNLSHSRTAVASRAPGTISIGASDLTYFEFVRTDAVGVGNNVAFGICATDSALSTSSYAGAPTNSGATANEWVLTDHGRACNGSTYTNLSATLGTFGQNDVGRVAVNRVTGKVWFGKNATWSGDPVAGTGEAFSNVTVDVQPLSYVYSGTLHFNAGQRPLAQSAPTGFKALCQRNLPDPAILNSSVAVAHRFEAGSGIAAAIASDRSGWSDWLEMFKRTDTTESWKVRFSDDSSNMLAFDTNGVKAAWSAPSTGTYLGVALRVGASYGLVTGTYSGDNTSNRNISHSLGKAPTCGIVKNESTGTWYVWHTKMTGATYFTTLNSATPPAQSNTNSPWGTGNWSSTQFMVTNNGTNNLNATGSTYRYILFSDISGLLALLGHTGNGSTDGSFEYTGHKAQLQIEKDLAATTGFYVWSDKIDTYNVTGSYLLLNTDAAIASATGVDIVSNGIKHRSATLANASNAHMDISYARVSGKYSLAR